MKTLTLVAVLATTVLATAMADDFFSAKYDNFDIRPVLENPAIFAGWMKCFLDRGPCTPEAEDFKKILPEALEIECGTCTPKHCQLIKEVLHHMVAVNIRYRNDLVSKYGHMVSCHLGYMA